MVRVLSRRDSSVEEPETNLTSMLDLIFNVLAFFVVTFKPPDPEANFDIKLPPPQKQEQQVATEIDDFNMDIMLLEYDTVTIRLDADENGNLDQVICGDRRIKPRYRDGNFNADHLMREIKRIVEHMQKETLTETGEVLDTADVICSADLKYVYLIHMVNSLHQAGIQKINFGGEQKGLSIP